MRNASAAASRGAATAAVALLGMQGGLLHAAEPAAPPPMRAMAPAPAGQYHLDKSHASLILRVSHSGFSHYTTRFSRFDAQLTFDPRNLSASKVTATIDAASLEMAPQRCLDIVKGPQYLDTEKYPRIVFESERVRMTGAKSMEISGTLTLHGVTRPVTLAGTFNGGTAGIPKREPSARIGFSAHGTFRRSEFGMGHGIPAPGATMGVGDLIDFSIEAEFIGPPMQSAASGKPVSTGSSSRG